MSKKTISRYLPLVEREPDKQKWLNDLMEETASDSTMDSYHTYSTSGSASSYGYQKCAHTHPGLVLHTAEGKALTIYGGACGSPVHQNLDIYVALDHGTAHDAQAYPWNGTREFIYFPITDMSAPKDVVEFKKMIDWLAAQVVEGKSVHVGCIGGHGRTGMVLAALVKTITGNEDAIGYVRQHYCQKAVESDAQVSFLHQQFGVKKVGGSKSSHYSSKTGWGDSFQATEQPEKMGWIHRGKVKAKRDERANALAKEYSKATEVKPVKVKGNIWGIIP